MLSQKTPCHVMEDAIVGPFVTPPVQMFAEYVEKLDCGKDGPIERHRVLAIGGVTEIVVVNGVTEKKCERCGEISGRDVSFKPLILDPEMNELVRADYLACSNYHFVGVKESEK